MVRFNNRIYNNADIPAQQCGGGEYFSGTKNRPCIARYVSNLQSSTVFNLYTLCTDCSSMNVCNIVQRNSKTFMTYNLKR